MSGALLLTNIIPYIVALLYLEIQYLIKGLLMNFCDLCVSGILETITTLGRWFTH